LKLLLLNNKTGIENKDLQFSLRGMFPIMPKIDAFILKNYGL